ncbi:MAG: MBL fold metallo-hydrolase [Bacteroidales bacterium]|nr:MBL fold metallo-hydrolase [Bacteroidales bacterium]
MGQFTTDSFTTEHGKSLEIAFVGHGSVNFNFDGKLICVDPTPSSGDYSAVSGADYILYTHAHGDHFDKELLNKLKKSGTVVVCTAEVAQQIGEDNTIDLHILANGDALSFSKDFHLDAVPAHNHPANKGFHPEGRDNGYLLNMDGFIVYVAGDTEDIEEMKALKGMNVNVAFLPVNQPYTMKIDQAVNAAEMFMPKIVYPYHYGPTNTAETMKELETRLAPKGIEVRIRPLQ